VLKISASDNDTGQVTYGGDFNSGIQRAAFVKEVLNAASYRVSQCCALVSASVEHTRQVTIGGTLKRLPSGRGFFAKPKEL